MNRTIDRYEPLDYPFALGGLEPALHAVLQVYEAYIRGGLAANPAGQRVEHYYAALRDLDVPLAEALSRVIDCMLDLDPGRERDIGGEG